MSATTVRYWWNRFGPMIAREIREKRVEARRTHRHWQWHLDEVYAKIKGITHYLWRAVDHEGEVLESAVTKTRDRKAALKFLKGLPQLSGSESMLRCSHGSEKPLSVSGENLGAQVSRSCTASRSTSSQLASRNSPGRCTKIALS